MRKCFSCFQPSYSLPFFSTHHLSGFYNNKKVLQSKNTLLGTFSVHCTTHSNNLATLLTSGLLARFNRTQLCLLKEAQGQRRKLDQPSSLLTPQMCKGHRNCPCKYKPSYWVFIAFSHFQCSSIFFF